MQIRSNEQLRAEFGEIRDQLVRALAADNTEDMAQLAMEAQASETGLRLYLDDLLGDSFALYDSKLDRDAIEPGRNALGEALERAEALGLAVDLPSMRGRVEEFRVATERAISALSEGLGLGQI